MMKRRSNAAGLLPRAVSVPSPTCRYGGSVSPCSGDSAGSRDATDAVTLDLQMADAPDAIGGEVAVPSPARASLSQHTRLACAGASADSTLGSPAVRSTTATWPPTWRSSSRRAGRPQAPRRWRPRRGCGRSSAVIQTRPARPPGACWPGCAGGGPAGVVVRRRPVRPRTWRPSSRQLPSWPRPRWRRGGCSLRQCHGADAPGDSGVSLPGSRARSRRAASRSVRLSVAHRRPIALKLR